MVDIQRMAGELQARTEWQKTPDALAQEDYCDLIAAALRKLYVVTGRAALYDPSKLVKESDIPVCYEADLQIDEEEYVLLTTEIAFFRKVQTDVNNVFGYTTDALTITNADKPYANLSATIQELENQQRILYYKMVRYTLI